MRPDVAAWFARRTSHARDWDPVILAESPRPSVAVVLPALNEARTIGPIVTAIRRDLVLGQRTNGSPLVDELLVVDSGSNDHTALVAARAGARVVQRRDTLPDIPELPGKGEVLWRGLAATTAEVVVFVDSDLDDFTSDFVTGLLGPLLTDPGIQLVKATYDRALRSGEHVLPAGGGRVTELLARPVLNAFWPQLAGFVQPLSGEYAGRRALLERLPFPTGYGVEVGLLVDALRVAGLDALAQVDLTSRRHRNSSDDKLGQMAAEILQVVMARLRSEGRLGDPSLGVAEPGVTQPGVAGLGGAERAPAVASHDLVQFLRDGHGYRIHVTDLTPHERAPLLETPGYRSPPVP